MQPSSALNKLCDLLKHASEQSSSPQGSLITVCLREADQIYVYPQTHASTMLMRGLRSVGYNVAIKTYPPSIHTLLMHSGENARVVLLEDSSVLPVVDNAACLIQAKITSAAILRDEEALVVWSMGTSNTIDAQFREWERRIARTASHAERQKQRQHQPAMHPAMISPYANDWMPFTDFQGVTPSTSRPSQDFIDLTSLEPRSDLPSLLELESLHGLDGREGCRETFPSDWLSPLEYASLYYHSPFLSPVSTPSTIDSLSPYSAQGTESSLEPSPFLGGTICLADISPVPLSFDDASLPDDDLPITVESADPSGEEESPSSPTNLRKIKGLPSRSLSTSPTPLSPLHLPEVPKSPKTPSESATSPKPHSPSLAQTTATPLFSSLSLRNSPPLSKKRKSPSPSPKSSTSSPKAGRSPLPTASAPLEIPESPNCEDDADGSTESDLSDLEDDGPAFEDPDDSDSDFEEPPPPKKTKVIAPKAAAKKARPGRRRGGGKASAAHKRKFKCETCDRRFTRDADKTRHLQSACEGAEKAHKCPECPAAFARKDALVRHCKNLHKDD